MLQKVVVSRELNVPDIRSRHTASGFKIPARVYFHNCGIQAYDNNRDLIEVTGLSHLRDIFGSKQVDLTDALYSIAVLWGFQEEGRSELSRMVDLFLPSEEVKTRWTANPSYSSYVFCDGLLLDTREFTCGDGVIILGEEEKYRRTRRDLDDFINNPPEIPGIKFS